MKMVGIAEKEREIGAGAGKLGIAEREKADSGRTTSRGDSGKSRIREFAGAGEHHPAVRCDPHAKEDRRRARRESVKRRWS